VSRLNDSLASHSRVRLARRSSKMPGTNGTRVNKAPQLMVTQNELIPYSRPNAVAAHTTNVAVTAATTKRAMAMTRMGARISVTDSWGTCTTGAAKTPTPRPLRALPWEEP
jgi:hypothetical protein